MQNNVITIFLDSVSWNSIENHRASVDPMPFISSLKSESVTASKLYSHGPYTDAAVRSLFTGRNCLDDFGYYFRLNESPINDFKLFHDAGYETYGFYYPFIMYGDKMKKYIDHTYYTSGFIFGSEWGGSFKYYYEKVKETPLTEVEFKLIKRRLSLFFEVIKTYLEEINNNKDSRILYERCLEGYDIPGAIEKLNIEYNKFKHSPNEYIHNFLSEGENHILWSIDTTRVDKVVDSKFLDSIVKENEEFFNLIKKNNRFANIFSSFPRPKQLWSDLKDLVRTGSPKEMVFTKKYFNSLREFDIMINLWHKPEWQVTHTSHSILSAGIDVIERNDLGKDKPFYMSLITEDPHNYLAMFAYDIQNKEEVNDEIRVLNNYVKELGTNFKGSLLYLLSLRYADYEVEKFCKKLKKLGLWDNTTLMILSDHGSAFTNYPIRKSSVNCFDEECYHVPVAIRHPGIKGITVDRYCNSKDILPTVCELVGIPASKYFKGKSMLDKEAHQEPYVLTEYMGPGCPDLTSRRMWLSARDENYLVAYKVGFYENFEDGELAEVYDYNKDPKGIKNIAKFINVERINYLLEPLRKRHSEIKQDVESFISSL